MVAKSVKRQKITNLSKTVLNQGANVIPSTPCDLNLWTPHIFTNPECHTRLQWFTLELWQPHVDHLRTQIVVAIPCVASRVLHVHKLRMFYNIFKPLAAISKFTLQRCDAN